MATHKKVVKKPTYELPSVPFIYKEQLHLKVIPCKRLFNSTTIYEVVTRGDCFAVNLETGVFTVVPGEML